MRSESPRKSTQLADGSALTAILSRCKLNPNDVLVPLALSVDDSFVLSIMVNVLARDFGPDDFARFLTPGSGARSSPRIRMAMLLAARQRDPRNETLAKLGLEDHDPDVRRLAVQWVAEEKLYDLRPGVVAVFNSTAITADLFMATLAALEMLDGTKPEDIDKTPAAKYVLPLLKDEKRPAAVRAQALRLVSPADPALDATLLSQLIRGSDALLRQEAIRTLQLAPVERAAPLLIPFAADAGHDRQLRADALAGLAVTAKIEQHGGAARKLLAQMLNSGDDVLRLESLRSARGLFADDPALQEAADVAVCGSTSRRPIEGPTPTMSWPTKSCWQSRDQKDCAACWNCSLAIEAAREQGRMAGPARFGAGRAILKRAGGCSSMPTGRAVRNVIR